MVLTREIHVGEVGVRPPCMDYPARFHLWHLPYPVLSLLYLPNSLILS